MVGNLGELALYGNLQDHFGPYDGIMISLSTGDDCLALHVAGVIMM